jgi:hypothetical protein
MIRWLKSLFAWRRVDRGSGWAYEENRITGERRAFRFASGHQPLDSRWLRAGTRWQIIDCYGVLRGDGEATQSAQGSLR